jgi:di/tricarboxylate transporter
MGAMHAEGWITLLILATSSVLFYKKWIPLEVTALSLPVVLFATGVLDGPRAALSGFASDAVITLAALFVIGAGLQESGVTTLLARALLRAGRADEMRLGIAVMAAACAVSAFMPNAAAVAMLLPAVALLSRRTPVAPSRLMIPLSFAAVLGGNLTLLGATPNLLVAERAREDAGIVLGMFDFSLVGLPMAVAGIAFMALVGRRMLPVRRPEDRLREALHPEAAVRNYGLTRTLFRMKILAKSRVAGRTIAESGLRARYGLEAVVIVREGRLRRQYLEPRPDTFLVAGDELFVEGDDEPAWRFAEDEIVQFGLARSEDVEAILGRGLTIAEVTVPPRSQVAGRTFKELAFRSRHGLNVLSLWRKGEAIRDGVADLPLEPGDAFLVSGKAQRLQGLARDPDWLVLTEHGVPEDASRAPMALAWLLVAIVPPSLHLAPATLSALAAALLMVASGCVGIAAAQRAIDWKVIFLVIGIVPVGEALKIHGVATLASDGLLRVTESMGSAGVLGALFLAGSAIAMASTNSTSAVLLAPVALELASRGAVEPKHALLAVAYGASCAFVLPVHQCNIQVMGPGGYVPRDFVRTGLALTAVVAVVAIALLAWW